MRRLAGIFVAEVTAVIVFSACNLDLKPYVDSLDSGTSSPSRDAGGGVDQPFEDARRSQQPEDSGVHNPLDGAPEGGQRKRVFVTSTTVSGNLGGVQGADARCAQAANAANLGGTFIAWISLTSAPAATRINDVGPWFLVDRTTRVFANKASITATAPEVPIDRDEKGVQVQAATVWTGTLTNGAASSNCTDFVSASKFTSGIEGLTSDKARWTEFTLIRCDSTLRLYCFEQ